MGPWECPMMLFSIPRVHGWYRLTPSLGPVTICAHRWVTRTPWCRIVECTTPILSRHRRMGPLECRSVLVRPPCVHRSYRPPHFLCRIRPVSFHAYRVVRITSSRQTHHRVVQPRPLDPYTAPQWVRTVPECHWSMRHLRMLTYVHMRPIHHILVSTPEVG